MKSSEILLDLDFTLDFIDYLYGESLCLNPYYSGRYSLSQFKPFDKVLVRES